MLSPTTKNGLLASPDAESGASTPYSDASWNMMTLEKDEDGFYPDVRDMYEFQSPFEYATSSYSGSNTSSPRNDNVTITRDNQGLLSHLAKKGKSWKMGARGEAQFVRKNNQWFVKFINGGMFPVMEDAGQLMVEFTPKSVDYIMEIGTANDDSHEFIVWKGNGKPLSPAGTKPCRWNSSLMWIATRSLTNGERTAMVLNQARCELMSYESTVVEVIKSESGRDIMWTSVPKGLKNKYNCSDLKTIGQWRQCQDYGIDITLLKPGMKVKMVIMGATITGKYETAPQLNAVPDPMLWGHYIISQVGAHAFSKPAPQPVEAVTRERTFPRVKSTRKPKTNKRKTNKMKRVTKVSASRFARPAPKVQKPPKLSNNNDFPALGAAPKKAPVKRGIWGRGSPIKRTLKAEKATFATCLSDSKPRTFSTTAKKSFLERGL